MIILNQMPGLLLEKLVLDNLSLPESIWYVYKSIIRELDIAAASGLVLLQYISNFLI